MTNLRTYTATTFAKAINENENVIKALIRECLTISYSNSPISNIINLVNNSDITEQNKQITTEFLATTLYNEPIKPFRNGRGFGLEIR